MPWGTGPSVVNRGGIDYWRTWFLVECESSGLFGVTKRHLPLLTVSNVGWKSYRAGTVLYLEDAPYFRGPKSHHRVCGPYEVIPKDPLPPGAVPTHVVEDRVIVYLEKAPSTGPWFDRSRVNRTIDGVPVTFRQIASQYDYFPFRFAIKRHRQYEVQVVPHERECWLCR